MRWSCWIRQAAGCNASGLEPARSPRWRLDILPPRDIDERLMPEISFRIPTRAGGLAAVLHTAPRSKKLVILVHGFTGNKMESSRLFVTAARAFARGGLNALRFDCIGSGDSDGEFFDMTPNTEIRDAKAAVAWARRQGYRSIGLLGLSMGGAVSICTAAQLPAGTLRSLVTWSSVPDFRWWQKNIWPRLRPYPTGRTSDPTHKVGRPFFKDLPERDVPESYLSLSIPCLQVQGDRDVEHFREKFAAFFSRAQGRRKHAVLPGADHTFENWKHRRKVIALSLAWLRKTLP